MTKHEYINYMEKALANKEEELKITECDSQYLKYFFETISTYIQILRICDKEIYFLHKATMAFEGLLESWLCEKINSNTNEVMDIDPSCYEATMKSVYTTKESFFLCRILASLPLIFFSIDMLSARAEELKNKINDSIAKEGKDSTNCRVKRAFEELSNEEWIDKFGCYKSDILCLEKLIGEQADFDEVMGRIIYLVKY